MRKILITGASSMIGHSLINQFLNAEEGSIIYAVVRKGCKRIGDLANLPTVHVVECDISDYKLLPSLIGEKIDVFYHLAWKSAGRYEERNFSAMSQCCNIAYTLDALDAALQLQAETFVGAGSQAEYGNVAHGDISPTTPVHPTQFYGIAKYSAGRLAMEQAKLYKMNCFWVRIFSVYGPRDVETTMVQSTIRKLLKGETPNFTSAEQRWDYLYCDDAADALRKIGYLIGNRVYCLGSGKAIKLKGYIQAIGAIVNPNISLGIGALPYPPNPVMNLCADISDLENDIGWKPTTEFETGILKTLEYIKNSYMDGTK